MSVVLKAGEGGGFEAPAKALREKCRPCGDGDCEGKACPVATAVCKGECVVEGVGHEAVITGCDTVECCDHLGLLGWAVGYSSADHAARGGATASGLAIV